MPLRSVKMKRFIFGFQRRVWCPKCTPLSSSCFIETTWFVAAFAIGLALLAPAARIGERPGDCRFRRGRPVGHRVLTLAGTLAAVTSPPGDGRADRERAPAGGR